MPGSIFIPIISAFDAKGILQAKSAMSGLAGVVKNLKTTAAAAAVSFATIATINFVKESIVAARDLERNMVGLQGVFGDMSPVMQQFTKDASAIGLSQVEASRASTFLGSVLKQSGFSMEETSKQTKNLVGLASDLAATYGYDVSEALTGMTALFRGEYDPIEKFGVAMKQAEVNALLAARGQKNLTGAALRNAQAQARLDLLYSRSQDAQGAYARQSDSLFVKQKNLTAVFKNLQASVGASLTDPLAKLLDSITPIVTALGPLLSQSMGNLVRIIQSLTPVIEPLINHLIMLLEVFNPILDLLIELIQPLLFPLVAVFKLLGTILKPLIPIITLVARVLGAILIPVVTVLSFAIGLAVKVLDMFIGALTSIPIIGDLFKTANDGLKDFTDGFVGFNDKLLDVKTTQNDLTAQLSKDIPSNPIDGITTASEEASKALDVLKEKVSSLIDDARSTQKSLMGAFNITKILDDNQDAITKSIVYVDGKFRTVVSGVSKGSQDLVSKFATNLTKLRTFYSNLTKLAEKGLSPELRQQLIDAGPDAGNATAEAILASGKEGIKGLNKTFAGIKSLAGTIGVQSARAMAKVGEKLGNGLIDGLMAQRDDLIAQAAQLGKDVAAAADEAIQLHLNMQQGQKYKEKNPSVTDIIKNTNPVISPVVVDVPGVSKGFQYMTANQFTNPFSANELGYTEFQTAQAKANQYNIIIKVEPGASNRDIGAALVKTITEYERTAGAGWRKG